MKHRISYWFKRKKYKFDRWMLTDGSTNLLLIILFAIVIAVIGSMKQYGGL